MQKGLNGIFIGEAHLVLAHWHVTFENSIYWCVRIGNYAVKMQAVKWFERRHVIGVCVAGLDNQRFIGIRLYVLVIQKAMILIHGDYHFVITVAMLPEVQALIGEDLLEIN